jgi:hypothetical protein
VAASGIRERLARLEAEIRPPTIPVDRVEFARSIGFTDPDPWQENLLRGESDRVLLNCSRQSGKSTVAAVIALHKALHASGSLILVLAPSERQAKELFSKIAAFYRVVAEVSTVPPESYRKLGMELQNGSRIEALPGTEKTVRGFSGVDLLIVDEAARVEDALYYAVRPMLAVSGGSLMMLSTPFGKRGVFFEEWTYGEGWERFEVPATEVPRISPHFLEGERKALGPWWYAQEYQCRFMETDDAVFTHEVVGRAITNEVEPLFLGGGSG